MTRIVNMSFGYKNSSRKKVSKESGRNDKGDC